MRLNRKYLQFNDLVFGGYDILNVAERSVDFKAEAQEINGSDGSYIGFKNGNIYAAPQTLAMTLRFDHRDLQCDEMDIYREYITENLVKPGKLWAIQGSYLLYANAYIESFSESYDEENEYYVEFNVDFSLYEGVFHFADPLKVFLKPYETCNFNDCLDYYTNETCNGACSECAGEGQKQSCNCLCDCEWLTDEYNFCNMGNKAVEKLHDRCGDTYKILYDCIAGAKVFGKTAMYGTKVCSTSEYPSVASGTVYSHTVKQTSKVIIRLIGNIKDPVIKFNGNTIKINGSFNGILVIEPSMDMYYTRGENCEITYLDPSKMEIFEGSTYEFVAHHGNNSIFVQNAACTSQYCVYVKIDAITI